MSLPKDIYFIVNTASNGVWGGNEWLWDKDNFKVYIFISYQKAREAIELIPNKDGYEAIQHYTLRS